MDDVPRRKRKFSPGRSGPSGGAPGSSGEVAAARVSGTNPRSGSHAHQAAATARTSATRSSASADSPQRRHGSPAHLSPLHPPSDDEDEASSAGSPRSKSRAVPMRRKARPRAGSGDRIAPMSPTDVLLSPVSRMLSGRLTGVHKRQRRCVEASCGTRVHCTRRWQRCRHVLHHACSSALCPLTTPLWRACPTSFMMPAVEAGAGVVSASRRAVKHPAMDRGSLLPRAPPPVDIVLGTSSEARHKVCLVHGAWRRAGALWRWVRHQSG